MLPYHLPTVPTLQGEITNTLLVTTGEVWVHDITFTFADGTCWDYTLSDFFLAWSYCEPGKPWHLTNNVSTQDPAFARRKRGRDDFDDEGEGDNVGDRPPKKIRGEPAPTPVRLCCAPLHCNATHA